MNCFSINFSSFHPNQVPIPVIFDVLCFKNIRFILLYFCLSILFILHSQFAFFQPSFSRFPPTFRFLAPSIFHVLQQTKNLFVLFFIFYFLKIVLASLFLFLLLFFFSRLEVFIFSPLIAPFFNHLFIFLSLNFSSFSPNRKPICIISLALFFTNIVFSTFSFLHLFYSIFPLLLYFSPLIHMPRF